VGPRGVASNNNGQAASATITLARAARDFWEEAGAPVPSTSAKSGDTITRM